MRLGILLMAGVLAWGAPQKELIYTKAPFANAHASTVVELAGGEVMSAWFGGTAEGKNDVAIWGARRVGGQWTAPVELVREPNIPCWNPVLFHTNDGKLWLYYKFGPAPDNWVAGRMVSGDEGKTWSKPEHIPAGIYGPIRAKPLVRKDGTIVSGTSVEAYRSWTVWIERSENGGESWTKFGPIGVPGSIVAAGGKRTGLIQPTIVEMGGDWLRLYARSTGDIGKIAVADSSDGGKTWTQAHPIDLPNPNAGIDSVTLADGRVVLLYNHTPKGRTPLNLAISQDGEHFTMFLELETEPGEYSYPAMVLAKNGDLLLTYTYKRESIRYVRVPAADLPK